MVKLLRLCVDYGEDKILAIKHRIPSHIVPTADMVRPYLKEPVESEVISLKNDIDVTTINLRKYDERYGVVNQ